MLILLQMLVRDSLVWKIIDVNKVGDAHTNKTNMKIKYHRHFHPHPPGWKTWKLEEKDAWEQASALQKGAELAFYHTWDVESGRFKDHELRCWDARSSMARECGFHWPLRHESFTVAKVPGWWSAWAPVR